MNLAETQVAAKRFIAIAVGLTVLYYASKFTFMGGRAVYLAIFPPPPEIPEAMFGKLPQLKMQSNTIVGNPVYTLDTIDGRLPQFEDRILVYAIVEPTPTLLSERKIKQLATDLQFNDQYTKKSSSEFVWIDGKNNRSMNANAVTENFNLQTQLATLGSVLSSTPTITETDAINMVSNYISSKSLMSAEDLETIELKTIPSQVAFGRLKHEVLDPAQAKIVKVDVFRHLNTYEVDKKGNKELLTSYPVLSENAKKALVSFQTTNNTEAYQFPIINFDYWEIDRENGSQYYLSDINSVWDTIKQGNGVVSYIKPPHKDYYDSVRNTAIDKIEIRDVYVAYFEPKKYSEDTKYIQPIYVFEGKYVPQGASPSSELGDIVIYYPAVRGDFVQ